MVFLITVCTIAVLQKQSFSHEFCFGRICEINLSQIWFFLKSKIGLQRVLINFLSRSNLYFVSLEESKDRFRKNKNHVFQNYIKKSFKILVKYL